MPGLIRNHVWLSVFVGCYVVVFGGLALRQGNDEFLLYTLAMLVYIAVIVVLDARVGLSSLALWGLGIWGVLHMAGGTVPIPTTIQDGNRSVLYAMRVASWLPRYDQFVHAFGFGVATIVCGEALAIAWSRGRHDIQSNAAPRRLAGSLAFGAVLMGMGLGAVNEVVEFTMTRILPETGVGGYTNTGWDLVSNMIGAVIGGLVCWKRS